jgi:DNA-binding GntR family transcriptional regulator
MKPMKRGSSLRERCAVAIRAGIITGDIRPGTLYSAPAIAQQFGVSATPVREAMLDLTNEGLVEPIRNRGFRVVELSERDLDEIHEIRLLLEVPPVVAVAGDQELLTDAIVARLRNVCAELERHAESDDVAAMIDLDTKFHNEILKLAGNRRLVELVGRLRHQTLRYGLREAAHATLVATATDHQKIVDALLEGDKGKVERVMREHLAANRGVLAERRDAPAVAAAAGSASTANGGAPPAGTWGTLPDA